MATFGGFDHILQFKDGGYEAHLISPVRDPPSIMKSIYKFDPKASQKDTVNIEEIKVQNTKEEGAVADERNAKRLERD